MCAFHVYFWLIIPCITCLPDFNECTVSIIKSTPWYVIKNSLPEIWDKVAEIMSAKFKSIWLPNPTINYVGENEQIKFSPTLCKYFTVADLPCCGMHVYRQCFYTHIGGISRRLGVFHNVINSNYTRQT